MAGQVPAHRTFVDVFGEIGYARGFVVFVILSALCALVSYGLRAFAPAARRLS